MSIAGDGLAISPRKLLVPANSLPARLARLPGVAAIIITVTTTATTAAPESLATRLRTISLRLSFIDGQSAAAEFGTVQCRNCFVGFSGIGHLYKREAA